MNESKAADPNAAAGELVLLRRLFAQFRRLHRSGALHLAAVRFLWCAAAIALLLVLIDAAAPLPATARLAASGLFIASIAIIVFWTWRRETRAQSIDRLVARRLESGLAPLQNDLINALDFGDRLSAPASIPAGEPMTESLMHRSIRLALEESAASPPGRALKPPSLRRERWLLLGVAATAGLAAIAFTDVFSAVVPRYLDPFGDHPPYSPTHVRVVPAGIEVDYNSRLKIVATTSGAPAKNAELVIESAAGRELNRLPMFEDARDAQTSAFFQTVEEIREPMRYYIAFPGGRSRRYDLALNKTPRIESVTLRLRPPEYAHLPERVRLLAEPLIKGYAGSAAQLTVASNRPLAGGEMQIAGESVKLGADGSNAANGLLTLAKAGELNIQVKDADGRQSEPWKGRIEIIPDDKPVISIVSPGMDSFAIPDAKIPLVIEASDDLGIKNVALVRNVNGSMDFRKLEYEGDGAQSAIHAVENLDLADLGAQPGDVISYYATASDSDPTGAKTVASPIYQLTVIAFKDYQTFTQQQTTAKELAQKYQDYSDRLQELARRQEALNKEDAAIQAKLEKGDPLDAAAKERLAQAEQRQRDLEQQASQLADDMRRDAQAAPVFDIEKSFKSELAKTADQVATATQRMQSAAPALGQAAQSAQAGTPPSQAGQMMAQAAADQKAALDALGQTSEQYEQKVASAAQALDRTAALLSDVEKFKFLYQRQEALERQSRLYKETADPSLDERIRLKELAEEQNDVRQELDRLKDDLRKHADAVGDEPPKVADDARKIADEIEKRRISPLMQQAGDQLGKGDGPGGQPPAALALEQMRQMIGICNSTGGAGGEMEQRLSITMSGRGMSMGDTLAQLRAGMAGGQGRIGQNGQGSGGTNGSASQFAMFGSEHFGTPTRESKIAGAHAKSQSLPDAEHPALATTMEEIAPSTAQKEIEAHGGERVMAEYRSMIDAYFKSLASEE